MTNDKLLMTNVNLSIIIVNYNVKEFLQNLIHSIYKAGENLKYEIIIVDNASDDGSVEFLREKFPQIKLIVNNKNLGFSKANNIGLKHASGRYILLLNPDTIVQEDTFEKMIIFFETTPDAGMAGCKILNPDGTLQLACRRSFPGPWTSFCKVTGLSNLFPNSRLFARYNLTYLNENETYEVDAISGSFMMIRREAYEKVGNLDEQFFMYGEDLDWCYRMQKTGYKVYYVHNTTIIHYKGESTKRSSMDETKVFYSAMHLFVKKHLATSFLVEFILRAAIGMRRFIAFWGRRKLIIISVILDFLFFDLSLLAAEEFYRVISNEWLGFHEYHLVLLYTIPALIHIIISSFTGAYKKESISVLKTFTSIIISFFVISSLTFFFKQFAYSRAVVILTYIFLFFILSFWRIIAKLVFKAGADKPEVGKKVLIVGLNDFVIQIAEKLKSKKTDIYSIAGLIGLSNRDIGKKIGEFEVVGSIENLIKVIRDKQVKEVIFSSQELSYNQMMTIVAKCQKENVEFKLVGNNLDFLVGKTSISVLEDIPLIQINYNISNPLLKFIKASFDYTIAVFVLFLIYPLIYFISKVSNKKTDFRKFILGVPEIFSKKVSFVGPKKVQNGKLYLGKRGLTGLWYIEDTDLVDHEKLDIFYAKNQNIWLDLEILGKTLNKMWETRS